MKYVKSVFGVVLLLLLCCVGVGSAQDLFQDFDSWSRELSVNTIKTNDNWVIWRCAVKSRSYGTSPMGAVWVTYSYDSATPSHLMTPFLTNGVGTVIVETAPKDGGVTIPVYLQTSTNGVDGWTNRVVFTNTTTTAKEWSFTTNSLNVYGGCYLRFQKGGSTYLGIDNVTIKPPPAKVDFGTPYTDPAAPMVGDAPNVYCTITPSSLASGVTAKLVYSVSGVYATNTMSETATPNLWRTDSPLPAQDVAGITVSYQIIATFSGTNALSPATVSSSYLVDTAPLESDYNSMSVIDDATVTMTLVSNRLWQGILNNGSALTSQHFRFQGANTNGSTQTWGDAAPDSTAMIVHGTAGLSEAAFTVDTLPAGDSLFLFNESNLTYSVNTADFNDFDGWTGATTVGDYEKDGWVIRDGRVDSDAGKYRGTMACYLSTNGYSYVRSPYLENGAGQISFWLRHWETNATPATKCFVQVSATGGTNDSEWTTIRTIDVNFSRFNRFVIERNNRYNRYVRLLGDTNSSSLAQLAIEDFMVAGAGAGVVMTNLANSPEVPALDDTVSVSVDLTTERGATLSSLTAYWRTGTSGGFTPITMQNTTGDTWVTVSDIPAASGDSSDGLGAGTVQYYVAASFSGYQSSLASPTPAPEGGSDSPASYVIESAEMTYSNVVHTPAQPVVNSSFDVEADIIPSGGAINPEVTLYYRIGTSGDYTGITMVQTNGSNHYMTETPVPTSNHPGTPMYYYITTVFQGPAAKSPVSYPSGGVSDPIRVLARIGTPRSAYTNLEVTGDYSGTMDLVQNNEWIGMLGKSTVSTPGFRFHGSSATNTVTWGDDSVTAGSLPLFGTSVAGESAITLSGSYSNAMIFYFNDSNLMYSANGCYLEDFSTFSPATAPQTVTNAAGWIIHEATVFNTNGAFDGNSLMLGGPAAGTQSYLRSPVFDGGVGNVSFRYRNPDETGTLPGRLDLQVRVAGGDWQTIQSVTNILSPDYIFHQFGYGNQQSDVEIQLVWNSADNPGDSQVAIDDFCVEEPGAYTLFTNLTYTPTNPTIADKVTVDVDITPINYATNVTASIWYRIGTNGSFTEAVMTNTGSFHFRTVPPIPRTAPGTVQYYVESSFTTPLENSTLHAYYPATGASGPASYSNSDTLVTDTSFESSEGWTRLVGTGKSATNNDWIVHHCEIRREDYDARFTGACWLESTGDALTSNSYVRTPFLANGVGAIQFKTYNYKLSVSDLLIQKSYNGSVWYTVASITSDNKDSWVEYTVPLQIEEGIYLRIYKEEQTEINSRVGIDDIEVSYPVAKAEISNVSYDPWYPADDERVKIACDIDSVSLFAPAIDITARVYYKSSTATNYTAAPIEMSRSGNHYETVGGIPAQTAGTTVDYYIESTFKGYTNIISYTPTYSPANAPSNAYSYNVRQHASSYSNIVVRTGGGDIDMKQVGDRDWLGIIHYDQPTNDAAFSVVGQGYYDGSYVFEGDSVIWGDSSLDRTNLPYIGTMTNGAHNIVIYGSLSGQYLLSFNEDTGEYTLRRGVYQNFDEWPASTVYFEDSFGAANPQIFRQDFQDTNDWPITVFGHNNENFDSVTWTNICITNYPPAVSDIFGSLNPTNSSSYVGVDATLLIPQVAGQAVMLNDNGYVRTHSGNRNEGTGIFTFDVRCVNDDMAPLSKDISQTNIFITAKIWARAVPINSTQDSFGHCYYSVFARYTDANNYYEMRFVQFNENKCDWELWKKSGGTLTRLYQSGSNKTKDGTLRGVHTIGLKVYNVDSTTVYLQPYVDAWQNGINDTSSPLSDPGKVGISCMDVDVAVDAITVVEIANKTDTSGTTVYQTDCDAADLVDWDTDSGKWTGSGNIFQRRGYTTTPLNFTVEYQVSGESTWNTVATYSDYTNSDYMTIATTINRPENMFVRIKQSNVAGDGHLIVDNLRAAYWHGSDIDDSNGWHGNQIVVTEDDSSRVLKMLKSQAYTNQVQYIKSPYMTNGASVIEFDYKAVSSTNELVFEIDYTVKDHSGTWQLGTVVTNSPAVLTPFSWRLPEGTNDYPMYMRISNVSSDFNAGMLVDNIRITEPIPYDNNAWRAYNDLITAAQTDKLLYEPGNVKGAYINNSETADTDGVTFSNAAPYIETSYLPDGIGEVSFWYRAWDANTSRIDIIVSDDRTLPETQWHLLRSISSITNQNFVQFQEDFYEPDYHFLRLRVPSQSQTFGRACVDNLMVAQPFGAMVYLRNMKLIPEQPLVGDSVYLQVELYDTFMNPSNILVKGVFELGSGDWGQYNNYFSRPMTLISTVGKVKTYRTTSPLTDGTYPVDQVVQYYAEADFDGFFSSKSSPARLKEFTNPSWYWPVDLNSNQTYKTPYYFIYSCRPGQVWINELNVTDDDWSTVITQYVEVCGSDRVNIGNWKLQVLNPDFTTNAEYTIGAGTTLIGNGGYGFFLLGGNNMPSADITMTNALPDAGAVKLFRSMGAQEDAVSWDIDSSTGPGYQMTQVDPRIVYAGMDDYFETYALSLYGTDGSNATDFVWAQDKAYTPGATNDQQILVPWGNETNSPSYSGSLQISSATMGNGRITFVVAAESNGVALTPWYTTNLVTGPWTVGVNSGQEVFSGTTYRVWCDLYTNAPGAFYKVTSP